MRQHFISVVCGAVLVLAFQPALAASAESEPLFGRIGAMAPPNTPWDAAWTRFRAHIDENTTDVDLRYLIRGEVGNEDEILKALRRNRVQISGASLQGLATLVPELTVAMSPYIFESEAEVDFVYDNFLLEPSRKLFAKKGLALLRWNEVGWTDLYANEAVILPSDAEGLKLRGAPNVSAQAFLLGIGANSIPIGSVDLVPALQRGLVRGGTSNAIFHFFQSRSYASHLTLTHHSYDTGAQMANKDWWDSLSSEHQAAIMEAFGPASVDRQAVRALADGLLQAMRDEGITVIELTPEQRAVWVERTQPLVFDIIDEVGGESQMIYDAILAGKEAFRATQMSSEPKIN